MLITIKVDSDKLLELLMHRVEFWADDEVKVGLFEQMYTRQINNYTFERKEFDVQDIVDNDVVNNCPMLKKDSVTPADWNKMLKLGVGKVSHENFESVGHFSAIEAIDKENEAILIRIKNA